MIFILVLLLFPALRVKFEKDCVGPRIVRAGANSVHAFHIALSIAPCFRYWMVAGTGEGWREERMRNWMHWQRVRIIIIVLLSLLFSDRLPAGELTQ